MLKPIWVLRCRCDKVSTTKLSNPLDFFDQTFPGFSKGFHLENTWVVKQAVSILLCDEVDHDELKLKRLRKVLDKSLGLNNRSSLVWPSAQTFTHTLYIYTYQSPCQYHQTCPPRPAPWSQLAASVAGQYPLDVATLCPQSVDVPPMSAAYQQQSPQSSLTSLLLPCKTFFREMQQGKKHEKTVWFVFCNVAACREA